MNIVRTVTRLVCTVAFSVVGIATLQGVAVAAFIISGVLVPGERMFGDGTTPSLAGAMGFSAAALAVAVVLAIVRHKLGSVSANQARTDRPVGA